MKKFVCALCGGEFDRLGANHKRCAECEKKWKNERHRLWRIKTGRNTGEGSGGKLGEFNQNWKNGIGRLKNYLGKILRVKIRYCETCGIDLLEATQYQWVIHHKDHNTTHNEEENLMLLCKKCHQIHHKCWTNFERATTRSNP